MSTMGAFRKGTNYTCPNDEINLEYRKGWEQRRAVFFFTTGV